MSHEVAKSLLARAESRPAREEAVRRAMSLGMPLHEIEAYLDWLDAIGPAGTPDGELGDPR